MRTRDSTGQAIQGPLQAPQVERAGTGAADRVKLGAFLLSQSGAALPVDAWRGDPIAPAGAFEKLIVTGLSPSGTRFSNEVAIDAEGRLVAKMGSHPLGHVPYQITLVGKDGSRYSAAVDITPKKIGVSHRGYETIQGLDLVREAPEAPPPPREVKLGKFLLSQSGAALPVDAWRGDPIAPAGAFEKLIVTGLSPSGTRSSNEVAIDAEGRLVAKMGSHPLGHVPYQITLVGKDGSRYSAVVDITPKKIGVSHRGYETISDLRVAREPAASTPELPLRPEDATFAQTGGALNASPTVKQSPTGVYFQSRGG